MIKVIKIKGKKEILIKVDGVWVYKYRRCKSCNKRLQFKKSQKRYGYIPSYCPGHNTIGTHRTLSQETKDKASKYRKELYRLYPEKNPMLGKHHSKESKEKTRKSVIEYYKNHPEAIESRRNENNAMFGKQHSKETTELMSILKKQYCEDHPEYLTNVRKRIRHVSKPEIKMRNYAIKLCKKRGINYLTNVHELIGTPDMVILNHQTGRHIALFEDGCQFHGCLKCFPIFKEKSNENYEFHSFKRNYDRMINKQLISKGFIIVRIWEHDINNGKYKKILKHTFEERNKTVI